MEHDKQRMHVLDVWNEDRTAMEEEAAKPSCS
jgi:hypothetical protein